MYNKPKLFLILSLIIGIVIGSSGMFFLSRYKMRKFNHRPSVEKMFMHMDKHLDFDDNQKRKVLSVIEKYSEEGRNIRGRFYSEMEALHDSVFKEVEPDLTENQVKKYKKWKHKFKKSHHSHQSHREKK